MPWSCVSAVYTMQCIYASWFILTLYSCIDFDSRVLSKAFVQEINTENYATSSIPGTVSANVHMKYMVQIYLNQSGFIAWVVWERQKFSPVSWRSSPKRPCHVAPRAHSRFQPVPSLQAGRTQSWPSFPVVPALCTPQISLGQSWSVGMFKGCRERNNITNIRILWY